MISFLKTRPTASPKISHGERTDKGFTLVEVLIAAMIMIILAVGVLSVFSFATKINAGNNLRAQALTVLQKEVEYYRSLKYVPDPVLSDDALNAGTYARPQRTSEDGTKFNLSVVITNVSGVSGNLSDNTSTLKEIKVIATAVNAQQGWLNNLHTDVTILRVRSN